MENNRTAYDWFVYRKDFDIDEKPTTEKAVKLAQWINSHGCKPVDADTVYQWLFEEYIDYITSTLTWNQ